MKPAALSSSTSMKTLTQTDMVALSGGEVTQAEACGFIAGASTVAALSGNLLVAGIGGIVFIAGCTSGDTRQQ